MSHLYGFGVALGDSTRHRRRFRNSAIPGGISCARAKGVLARQGRQGRLFPTRRERHEAYGRKRPASDMWVTSPRRARDARPASKPADDLGDMPQRRAQRRVFPASLLHPLSALGAAPPPRAGAELLGRFRKVGEGSRLPPGPLVSQKGACNHSPIGAQLPLCKLEILPETPVSLGKGE